MATRAMWKAVLRVGGLNVPVKLYAAIEDRSVHFRLLHKTDHAPVKQGLVNPVTDQVVEYSAARRAWASPEGDLVILKDEELAETEPQASRDIEVVQFLPPQAIDHRWYLRPYYLGPDQGGTADYFALAGALAKSGREGLAHWVMRKKAYVGALRLHAGYPMLIALHNAEDVVSIEDLEAPAGPALDRKELGMAQQLMSMLADDFEPAAYHDEYRERVEQLIATKRSGGKVRTLRPAKPKASEDLTRALQASIKERKHA
ncbi:MAG: Ku protein [Thiogranum sp.]|nr:Ku protein [Thiogranum sp.]